jgi:hypothetical protein
MALAVVADLSRAAALADTDRVVAEPESVTQMPAAPLVSAWAGGTEAATGSRTAANAAPMNAGQVVSRFENTKNETGLLKRSSRPMRLCDGIGPCRAERL